MPFTPEAFLAVFAAYDRALWPAAAVAYALGAAAVAGAARGGRAGARLAWGVLALLWLWDGIAYHALFFARINPAAYGFAALFVLQGALLGAAAREPAPFRFRPGPRGWAGAALVAHATLLYPALNLFLGHGWPHMPLFGVTPCPTTLFTVGLLLWAETPVRRLAAIPLAWSLIGTSAAWLLGVWEDLALLGATGAAAWLLTRRQAA